MSLICSFDSEIPEIQADDEKLSRVCINLLLNACEASRQESTIWVSSRYHPNAVIPGIEIIIEDEGSGIIETQLDDIFKPFFTTKEGGTGVGLTNVKHIVRAHKGWVKAANRQPCGAVFRVWLSV